MLGLFQRILVPVDGSAFSDRIVQLVRALIRSGGVGQVWLIQAVPPDCPYAELEAARDRLLRVGKALSPRDVIVDVVAVRGEPVAEILAAAKRVKPTLVAMATHGRKGLDRLIRGSVAEAVLRRCRVPVILANRRGLSFAETNPVERLTFSPNGSSRVDDVLSLVEGFKQDPTPRITLLDVRSPGDSQAAPSSQGSEVTGVSPNRLEQWRTQLGKAGVPAQIRWTCGSMAAEILEAARDSDLVAMTQDGRWGPSRWILGSIAESVARECTVPTLIYPGEGAEADPLTSFRAHSEPQIHRK